MRREGDEQEVIAGEGFGDALIGGEIGIAFDDERLRRSVEAKAR